ncbi:MAG TPA: dephospho-CoA kinase [Flavilitoribacter sp.]|nr:dephospho-CoA kinase [Flavilitoribacter sp.]
MLHIGITGGIGSGKSSVCRIFEVLGIPVYYADDRAKWLMNHDQDLKSGITGLFGEQAYLENGDLNRKFIGSIAFTDPEKLSGLNALVHPAVLRDGFEWQEAQANVPYTLKEAALLFESGSYKFLDKVITVYAPLELRLQRVMTRDGVDRETVMNRVTQQMPEEEKLKLADYVIYNDGTRSIIGQVMALHRGLVGGIEELPPSLLMSSGGRGRN